VHLYTNYGKHVCVGKHWSKFKHVSLVVKQFALLSTSWYRRELASAGRIPHTYDERSSDDCTRLCHDLVSYFYHCLVDGFRITANLKRAILSDVRETTKHVRPRDSHLVKNEPAVVLRVVAQFRTNVTHFHTSTG
jgi:hypothetical protein